MNAANQPLGSLAQASRHKQLNSARWILIVVGVLTMALNLFMFSNAVKEVETATEQQMRAEGMVVVDKELFEAEKAKIVKTVRVIYGVSVLLGVALVVCGFMVYRAPVATTLTGLIIYVGGIAAFAYFDASNLARGIIIKVIIIVALVKAVQAAIAYQKEQTVTPEPAAGA